MILHFGLPLHPAAGGTQFSPAAILLTTQESENGIAMHGHVVLKNSSDHDARVHAFDTAAVDAVCQSHTSTL